MPDQSDYEAADEVLRQSNVEERLVEHVRELLAKLHEGLGPSSFRLYYNLRKPTSRQEVWAYQHFHGEITTEELKQRMQAHAERPVDQEIINEAYDQVEAWLQHYSRALLAAAETLKSGCSPNRRERLERLATRSLARTEGQFRLDFEELKTLYAFIDRMRLERGLGLAAVEGESATNAIHLTLLVFRNAVLHWDSCSRIAKNSRTNANYLYAMTAAQLLFGKDGPKLPKPQNLMALLTQERSAATITLADQTAPPKPKEFSEAVINVQKATINVDELQSAMAEATAEKDSQKLSVGNWSDLAIGIDASRVAWALTPAPAIGQRFQKSKALRLRLRGTPWKRLVEELAKSPEGNTAPIAELAVAFGLLSPSSTVTVDKRAKPGEVREGTIAGLDSRGAVVRESVRKKVNDLARSLRSSVDGPKGDEGPCLWLEENHVHAGFTVQYLHREDNRTFTFGARRQ